MNSIRISCVLLLALVNIAMGSNGQNTVRIRTKTEFLSSAAQSSSLNPAAVDSPHTIPESQSGFKADENSTNNSICPKCIITWSGEMQKAKDYIKLTTIIIFK